MTLTKTELYYALLGYVGQDRQELTAFLYLRGADEEPPLSVDDAYSQAKEIVEFLDNELQRAQQEEGD